MTQRAVNELVAAVVLMLGFLLGLGVRGCAVPSQRCGTLEFRCEEKREAIGCKFLWTTNDGGCKPQDKVVGDGL